MAKLWIAEFARLQRDDRAEMQAPENPPLAEQVIDYSGGEAKTANPLNAKTRLIRVHTDAACSIAIGSKAAPTPAATTSTMRLAAGQTEYFGIGAFDAAAGTVKVSAIANP